MSKKRKMKKIAISAIGVVLAFSLLVGGNLGLFAQANEANAESQNDISVSSTLPPEGVEQPENSEEIVESEVVEQPISSEETTGDAVSTEPDSVLPDSSEVTSEDGSLADDVTSSSTESEVPSSSRTESIAEADDRTTDEISLADNVILNISVDEGNTTKSLDNTWAAKPITYSVTIMNNSDYPLVTNGSSTEGVAGPKITLELDNGLIIKTSNNDDNSLFTEKRDGSANKPYIKVDSLDELKTFETEVWQEIPSRSSVSISFTAYSTSPADLTLTATVEGTFGDANNTNLQATNTFTMPYTAEYGFIKDAINDGDVTANDLFSYGSNFGVTNYLSINQGTGGKWKGTSFWKDGDTVNKDHYGYIENYQIVRILSEEEAVELQKPVNSKAMISFTDANIEIPYKLEPNTSTGEWEMRWNFGPLGPGMFNSIFHTTNYFNSYVDKTYFGLKNPDGSVNESVIDPSFIGKSYTFYDSLRDGDFVLNPQLGAPGTVIIKEPDEPSTPTEKATTYSYALSSSVTNAKIYEATRNNADLRLRFVFAPGNLTVTDLPFKNIVTTIDIPSDIELLQLQGINTLNLNKIEANYNGTWKTLVENQSAFISDANYTFATEDATPTQIRFTANEWNGNNGKDTTPVFTFKLKDEVTESKSFPFKISSSTYQKPDGQTVSKTGLPNFIFQYIAEMQNSLQHNMNVSLPQLQNKTFIKGDTLALDDSVIARNGIIKNSFYFIKVPKGTTVKSAKFTESMQTIETDNYTIFYWQTGDINSTLNGTQEKRFQTSFSLDNVAAGDYVLQVGFGTLDPNNIISEYVPAGQLNQSGTPTDSKQPIPSEIKDVLGITGVDNYYTQSYNIAVAAGNAYTSSSKVKGTADSDFSANGNTVAGGQAQYSMSFINSGNLNYEATEVVNILPGIGDTLTTSNIARGSEYGPLLNDIEVLRNGQVDDSLVLYYSTSSDPTRFDTSNNIIGSGEWVTFLQNISRAKAVKVVSNTPFEPGEEITLNYTVTVPFDVPNGALANNTMGVHAVSTGGTILNIETATSRLKTEVSQDVGTISGRAYSNFTGGVHEGLNNVTFTLYKNDGTDAYTPVTGGVATSTIGYDGQNGLFGFADLEYGTYRVKVDISGIPGATFLQKGSDEKYSVQPITSPAGSTPTGKETTGWISIDGVRNLTIDDSNLAAYSNIISDLEVDIAMETVLGGTINFIDKNGTVINSTGLLENYTVSATSADGTKNYGQATTDASGVFSLPLENFTSSGAVDLTLNLDGKTLVPYADSTNVINIANVVLGSGTDDSLIFKLTDTDLPSANITMETKYNPSSITGSVSDTSTPVQGTWEIFAPSGESTGYSGTFTNSVDVTKELQYLIGDAKNDSSLYGEYTFKVTATDLAKNETVVEDVFNIIQPPTINANDIEYPLNEVVSEEQFLLDIGYSATTVVPDATIVSETNDFSTAVSFDKEGTYTVTFTAKDSVGLEATKTITVTVKVKTYTVNFHANNGVNPEQTATQIINRNAETALNANSFTKPGYSFVNWSTVEAPTEENPGTTYADLATVTNLAAIDATIDLYAQWEANSYTVKFATGRADNEDTQVVNGTMADVQLNYDNNESMLPDNQFTRDGYEFAGWTYTAENGSVQTISVEGLQNKNGNEAWNLTTQSEVTLTAVWNASAKNIIFNANKPEKASETNNIINLPENISTFTDATVDLTGVINQDPKPELAGYTFQGWFDAAVDGNQMPNPSVKMQASDITYYAHWKAEEQTITFNGNGTTEDPATDFTSEFKANTDEEITLDPGTPKRTGYEFQGWLNDSDSTNTPVEFPLTITMLAGGGSYTAQWTVNNYTITFDANGGSPQPDPIEQNYGTTITYPTTEPTRAGYAFNGWLGSNGETPENTTTMPANDITYVAQWTAEEQTITFDGNGEGDTVTNFTSEFKANTDEEITLDPGTPERDGYEFQGWVNDSDSTNTPVDFPLTMTMPAGGASYTAQWIPNKYTITFDVNGGSPQPDPIEQDYRTTVNYPTTEPARDGYEFKGWFDKDGKTPAQVPTMPLNGAKFTAKWDPLAQSILFDKNSGDAPVSNMPDAIEADTDTTVDLTGVMNQDPKPERAGYKFEGWYTNQDGELLEENKMPDTLQMPPTSVTYYARWTAEEQTITFDGNGEGDTVTNFTSEFKANTDEEIALDPGTPERTGYTFNGWVDVSDSTNTPVDFPLTVTMPAGGATYKAQWEINQYTVTFDKNSGNDTVENLPSAITGNYKATVELPIDSEPTRTGYTFGGWVDADGNPMPSSIEMPLDGIEYKATWTINQYTISFEDSTEDTTLAGMPEAITADYNATVTLPQDVKPTREGYTFKEWIDADGNPMPSSIEMPENGKTYYTSWEADPGYITFIAKSDGLTGTVGDLPEAIKKNTGDIVVFADENIKTPTLSGYSFAGWVDGDGNSMPDSIEFPASGLKYYTTWTPLQNDIIFDKNAPDATSEQATLSLDTDSLLDKSTVVPPTRLGYSFLGWFSVAEETGGTELPEQYKIPAGGATFYARWSANDQYIKFDGNAEDAKNVPSQIKTKTGVEYDLSGVEEPSRDGYTFVDWFDAEGNPMPDSLVVADGGMTYYAHWSGLDQVITFEANTKDRTGNDLVGTLPTMPNDITLGTGEEVVYANYITSDPSLTGYAFAGWFDAAVDGNQMPAQENMPYLGKTYYAQWQAENQTISFKTGVGAPEDAVIEYPEDIVSATGTTVKNLNSYAGTPVLAGYEFKGWYTTSGGQDKMPDETVMPGEGIIYYSQWEVEQQSVKFDPNGDNVTGMPDSIPADTDATVDLSNIAEPTRIGYQFAGWKVSSDPEETVSMPESIEKMPAESITYYAHWTANKYAVIFDGNGNTSGTMVDQPFEYDRLQSLSSNLYEKTGYTFDSWNTHADGSGEKYIDGQSVSNLSVIDDSSVKLYAQWKANTYTVIFDGNGNTSGTMETQTFTYDAEPTALNANVYQKTNYKFAGWVDANGTEYSDQELVSNLVSDPDGSITLTAVWGDTYTLTANDFIVEKDDVAGLIADVELIKQAASAESVVNGGGTAPDITVTTNNIQNIAGTYEVTFESQGETVTVKATVKDADYINVGSEYAIQANNISATSKEIANMNAAPDGYVARSLAKAWTVDFENTYVTTGISVDSSKVEAKAGTYEIYYSYGGATVKAYIAVTDADHGLVENGEAIQANDFTIPLSEANNLDDLSTYREKSGAVAWKADQAGKVSLGDITVVDTNVQKSVGTYTVTYKTNTTNATSIDALVTIYDDNYNIIVTPNIGEAVEAKDVVVTAEQVQAGLAQSYYIEEADAHGWTTDGSNTPVEVTTMTGVVKAERGVYPVYYSTENNAQVKAYVSVADGDVVSGDGLNKETLQANNFIVKGTQVSNGISQEEYKKHGTAYAWTWDENGTESPIDNIIVDDQYVAPEEGTYPITYTLSSGATVTVMVTVQTADVINVDLNANKAIQANNFQIKKWEVEDGKLTGNYAFDGAKPVAWVTDGTNEPIDINMDSIDLSAVQAAVGHYPVSFETIGDNPIRVTVDLEVLANNITLVTFDGNGATKEAVPYTIGVEEPSTEISSIPSQDPERTGYTFIGWNTKADGTGEKFVEGSKVLKAMTVYAQWSINKYTVSFDTQGGNNTPKAQTITYQDLVTRPTADPTLKGHSFIGWFTKPSGGVYWDFEKTQMPAENITLYAQYSVNQYVVTFDANNGTSPSYQNVYYGEHVEQIEDPYLYGYTFLGWKNSDGAYWNFAENYMPDNNITLTAEWERTPYTVTYMTFDQSEVIAKYELFAGDKVPEANAPNVGGHHFAYWSLGDTDNKWNTYNVMPAQNLVLVARYDKNDPDSSNNNTNTGNNNDNSKANVISKSNSGSTSTSDNSTSAISSISSSEAISTNSVSEQVTTSITVSNSVAAVSQAASSTAVISDSNIIIGGSGEWSLLALLLTIVSVVLSIILLLLAFKKGNSMAFGLIGAIIGIVSVVLFFIFNKLGGDMVISNLPTLYIAAAAILQLVAIFLTKGDKDEDDSVETEE